MDLFSFFNSSTSYRVRIALALKGVGFDYHGINIRTGEHREAAFVAEHNPSASVPAIEEGGFRLGQSLAIIDWLDARFPEPRLIPPESDHRARVLELSYAIACDIHPVNNLRVLNYLTKNMQVPAAGKAEWYGHWIAEGMAAVERLLLRAGSEFPGAWSVGDEPTMADCCLIPQLANARRMGCDLSAYTRATAIYEAAIEHPAFIAAAPENQPDFAP
ncbi:maleylacetoacetate isomerase [Novosphingobium sp. KA1]|uniref:maleylacetoacetate isomerase n=1 Tax=Novosphingobium sp. (strain KA1) TaxID=164608 RepID=UPI001A8CA7B7|nr:maleylacetoacetate isomerase [Novosphingobium sp. KA1]QSR19334.1 maleylacetoacetate isomerase [Novosphingobium sp. KA1]